MTVNGKETELAVDERESLLDTLRNRLGQRFRSRTGRSRSRDRERIPARWRFLKKTDTLRIPCDRRCYGRENRRNHIP